MLQIFSIVIIMSLFWAFVMFRSNKGAKASLAFNRGLMFGFTSSTSYYELEDETDEFFQVGLGLLILTIAWTYEGE